MLRELATSQPTGEPRRRWFADDDFDLILWFDERGGVWGFELCYDRGRAEHALTWTAEAGYSHSRVDGGEPDPTTNRTPILLPDGPVPLDDIVPRFDAHSADLDAPIRAFVLDKLRRYRASRA